ncbi:hypothetical protein B0T16DRAFT_400825 [Cercophora newfieldiana]|uniref:gamma-glutamylcyclotransferase n=1 Tax=Cercophora newfieldiana TaxID=92897 RepID=A0AA40CZD4_9PEZI|nr:hypothetical protein B0T16DRAFT_400825 [Cercophora newfieldiana]
MVSPKKAPKPSVDAAARYRSRRSSDAGLSTWRRFQTLHSTPKPKAPTYPPISSIPRTPATRLSQPDASPSPFPAEPVLAADFDSQAPSQPPTLLYLAYGSNLSAETFLGRRQIRPLSAVNVSAPSLRLVFDLPGLPYAEPCFANTALRKIPGGPPKLPPEVPDLPDLPDPPPFKPPHHRSFKRNSAGDPIWDNGLIGVVYEVTAEDYAKIIATEGGGASYQQILVPCLPLPPSVGVPEKPPIPELPKPFIARTLYAPRLPDIPDDDDKATAADDGDGDDGDDPAEPTPPEPPSWFRKLLLPVRRPDPDYAQPSARYLKLITDGAAEHDLPGEYQEYLQALQPYAVTTLRQKIGKILFLGFWAPLFLLAFIGGRFFANKEGKTPAWLAATMSVVINLVWVSYDAIAKPLFGDGERTMKEGDCGDSAKAQRARRYSWIRGDGAGDDEEKRCLLSGISGR